MKKKLLILAVLIGGLTAGSALCMDSGNSSNVTYESAKKAFNQLCRDQQAPMESVCESAFIYAGMILAGKPFKEETLKEVKTRLESATTSQDAQDLIAKLQQQLQDLLRIHRFSSVIHL